MPNRNHPAKGSKIKVEPIRELSDIETIKKMLAARPRDLAVFVLGINSGLRVGDLLRAGQVRRLKPGDTLPLVESKTGKPNVLVVNKTVYKALKAYLAAAALSDEDFLFVSRKGKGSRPLSTSSVTQRVKEWCRVLRLPGNFGAHSLRKTFGYVQRVYFGVGFEVLARRFN